MNIEVEIVLAAIDLLETFALFLSRLLAPSLGSGESEFFYGTFIPMSIDNVHFIFFLGASYR